MPKFLRTPIIISRTGKDTNFKFRTHIYSYDRKKRPLKILGTVAVGVLRDSRNFSGHPYIGRIARSSFVVAQLSCFTSGPLFLHLLYDV